MSVKHDLTARTVSYAYGIIRVSVHWNQVVERHSSTCKQTAEFALRTELFQQIAPQQCFYE